MRTNPVVLRAFVPIQPQSRRSSPLVVGGGPELGVLDPEIGVVGGGVIDAGAGDVGRARLDVAVAVGDVDGAAMARVQLYVVAGGERGGQNS